MGASVIGWERSHERPECEHRTPFFGRGSRSEPYIGYTFGKGVCSGDTELVCKISVEDKNTRCVPVFLPSVCFAMDHVEFMEEVGWVKDAQLRESLAKIFTFRRVLLH